MPEKYLYLADTLSRVYIGEANGEYVEEVVMVHTVQVSEHREASLRAVYQSDSVIAELKHTMLNSWL